MRVRRSELTTPGSSPEMMEKAAASAADEVMLDLEDAVSPAEKKDARGKIVDAIATYDWSDKTVAVRINGLDTRFAYGDIVDVVSGAGTGVDVIIVPKIEHAADVYMVDKLLSGIEADEGIDTAIGVEVLIEETEAMQNIDDIAAASDRLEALIFGPGDYSASQGVKLDSIGASGDYPGDVWHYARNKIVIAARSNGLAAIDGPYGDFSDTEGYRTECHRSNLLGFVGKWAIHPSQIEIANEVYSPDADRVAHARRVIDAVEEATAEGAGSARLDGEMLDAASVRRAREILDRAETVEGS